MLASSQSWITAGYILMVRATTNSLDMLVHGHNFAHQTLIPVVLWCYFTLAQMEFGPCWWPWMGIEQWFLIIIIDLQMISFHPCFDPGNALFKKLNISRRITPDDKNYIQLSIICVYVDENGISWYMYHAPMGKVYTIKRIGLRADPCGTPLCQTLGFDDEFAPILTVCLR